MAEMGVRVGSPPPPPLKKFLGKNRPNGADIAVFGILESIESLPSFEIIKANTKVYQWYSSLKQLTSLKPIQVK